MKKQLLVAGGGIGGLAAALAASRAGWEVRLYERAAAFSEVGAGVQLGPNVVRRLQAWGLQQPLQDVAAFPDRLQVRSALSGHELAVLPLGADAVQRYGAAYATIHRADLHGLLLKAVQARDSVQLNLNLAIEHHTEAHGAVLVRTSQAKEVEGDALVGADGLWSGTRMRLLGDGPPHPPHHRLAGAATARRAIPGASGRASEPGGHCAGYSPGGPAKLGPRRQCRRSGARPVGHLYRTARPGTPHSHLWQWLETLAAVRPATAAQC